MNVIDEGTDCSRLLDRLVVPVLRLFYLLDVRERFLVRILRDDERELFARPELVLLGHGRRVLDDLDELLGVAALLLDPVRHVTLVDFRRADALDGLRLS